MASTPDPEGIPVAPETRGYRSWSSTAGYSPVNAWCDRVMDRLTVRQIYTAGPEETPPRPKQHMVSGTP